MDDSFTWIKSGWGGEHSLKLGAAYSRNAALPQGTAANFIGLFTFPTDVPFNVADAKTYPYRFGIAMGQFDFTEIDHRASGYISDKWQLNHQAHPQHRRPLRLAEGDAKDQGRHRSAVRRRLRHARRRQDADSRRLRQGLPVPAAGDSRDARAARRYRADAGVSTRRRWPRRPSPARSRSSRGRRTQPLASTRSPGTDAGEAVISPACRAYLARTHARQCSPAASSTTRPPGRSSTAIGTWRTPGRSARGIKREVGEQHGRLDRLRRQPRQGQHRGDRHQRGAGQSGDRPRHPAWRGCVRSRRASSCRPRRAEHHLRPVQPGTDQRARVGAQYRLQLARAGAGKADVATTGPDASATPTRPAIDVASIIVDSNPRLDYGRCDRDNTHAFAASTNVDLGNGFGAGLRVPARIRATRSTKPPARDVNGDGTTNDRPMQGVNDLATLPSGNPARSCRQLDSRGVAVRNGIDGEAKTILDGRFQYVAPLRRATRPGCSWRSTT